MGSAFLMKSKPGLMAAELLRGGSSWPLSCSSCQMLSQGTYVSLVVRPESNGRSSGPASRRSHDELEGQRISTCGEDGSMWAKSMLAQSESCLRGGGKDLRKGIQEHLGVRIISAIVGNTSPGGRGCCEGQRRNRHPGHGNIHRVHSCGALCAA